MGQFPDPHARLGNALANNFGVQIVESRQTPWASATFSGARHRFLVRVPDCADLRPNLDEGEFELPGHILADIVLREPEAHTDTGLFTIEALTVEDA